VPQVTQYEEDKGWERIKEQHKVLEDNKAVVGITKSYTYPDGTSGAYVGAIHEFGLGPHTEKNWLSGGIKEAEDRIKKTLKSEYKALISGTSDGKTVLKEGAMDARDAVREKIVRIDLQDTERLKNQTRAAVWSESKIAKGNQFTSRSSAASFT